MDDSQVRQKNSQDFKTDQKEKLLKMLRNRVLNFHLTRRVEEHLAKQNPIDEEIRVNGEGSVLENEINNPIRVFCLDIFYVIYEKKKFFISRGRQ